VSEILDITLRSLHISVTATLLATLWSLPTATIMALKDFRARQLAKGIFNALMGMPTVALGLILYLLLSTAGPLGSLDILFTPLAIVIGQALLVTPILISLITNAVESINPEIKDLARTLGASEAEASLAILSEAKASILLALIAGFTRAFAELGVALSVGANLRGGTRILTTAIAMEVQRGQVEHGLTLTAILLSVVFVITIATNLLQRRKT
jgi:tungstate transport system permease protein